MPSDTGGPTDPIPQEVREKIEKEAEFGGNARTYLCHPGDIYFNAFISGGSLGYSLALPRIKELEQENERLREAFIKLKGSDLLLVTKRGPQALAGKKEGEV